MTTKSDRARGRRRRTKADDDFSRAMFAELLRARKAGKLPTPRNAKERAMYGVAYATMVGLL